MDYWDNKVFIIFEIYWDYDSLDNDLVAFQSISFLKNIDLDV